MCHHNLLFMVHHVSAYTFSFVAIDAAELEY